MRSASRTTSAGLLGASIPGIAALFGACAEPDAEPVRSEVAAAAQAESRQITEEQRESTQLVEAQLRSALEDAGQRVEAAELRAEHAEQRSEAAEQRAEAAEGRASRAEASEHELVAELEALRAEPAELAREELSQALVDAQRSAREARIESEARLLAQSEELASARSALASERARGEELALEVARQAAEVEELSIDRRTQRLAAEHARAEQAQTRAELERAQVSLAQLSEQLLQNGEARVTELEGELEAARSALALVQGELASTAERKSALESQLAELEHELADQLEARFARESAWLEYSQAIGALDLRAIVEELGFPPDHPALAELDPYAALEPEEPAEPEEPDRGVERAAEIRSHMRGLFLAEGVHGLDPLELGRVEGGSVGPVVFRLLDADGRLTGSLAAASLRMEASFAARSVTLVLSDGHESRGGERHPFADGLRRIPLVHVDPADWIELMPELFPSEDVIAIVDDGEWEVQRLRVALDGLLKDDAGDGWYELHHLAGVVDDELRGVHLVQRGRDGRVQRDLVADAMRLELGELGVVLVLRDGVTIQGERTLAFLDGVMRLVLPRASHARWRLADLPGIPREAPSEESSTGAPAGDPLAPSGEERG